MSAVLSMPVQNRAPEATSALTALLDRQRAAFYKNGMSTAKQRVESLNILAAAIGEYKHKIVDAISTDFGHRSPHETMAIDILTPLSEILLTKRKIKSWMKTRKAPFSMLTATGRGYIKYQPKGVVGIMGAWNYPAYLMFSPLTCIIAAGNHSMIKPPDASVALGEVLKEMFAKNFDENHIAVVTGDVNTSIEFSKLPFDHLMYTGSSSIGRSVMIEAAKNLTPVTLEMGGKSPAIVADDYSMDKATTRVLSGKCLNSGQTCIAPDYVLISKRREKEFIDTCMTKLAKRYPSLVDNEDITWIVNDRHFHRINALIDDAVAKGAVKHQFNPTKQPIPAGKRIIPQTFLTNVNDSMDIMHSEIFGPVLPIVPVESPKEAVDYVNARPRPLALYYFGSDKKEADYIMTNTISGGACINETVLHALSETMAFGGVGPSGLGGYHGFDGFTEFSHKKSIFKQGMLSLPSILTPPYNGQKVRKVLDWISDKLD